VRKGCADHVAVTVSKQNGVTIEQSSMTSWLTRLQTDATAIRTH